MFYTNTIRLCELFVIINAFIAIIIGLHSTESKLNFYVNKDEIQKLLGLTAEINYIKNGHINDYALGFVITVPSNITDLYYTWSSPIPSIRYSIGFKVSDTLAMETPTLNISNDGFVPINEQVFQVSLICSGRVAEVEIQMMVNLTMPYTNNQTELVLKRKKICIKSDQTSGSIDNNNIRLKPSVIDQKIGSRDSSALSIIVASGSCFILIVALLALLCYFLYVRSQKDRRTQTNDYEGSLTNISSKSGHIYLRVDTPSNIAISRNGSHYSSFRGFLNAPPNSLYRTLSVPIYTHNKHNMNTRLSDKSCDLEVNRKKILLQQNIMEGTFGKVVFGLIVTNFNEMSAESKVMIKTVSDQASKYQISVFLSEGMRFKALKHPNILSISGTCIDDPHRPLLIYPYMNSGNLKLFLLKSSTHKYSSETQIHTFLTQDLVQMAIHITSAVIYLNSQNMIHRDLSTRNCLVQTNDQNSFLVKLCDNALSRDLFPNDYHCLGDNENRPIKWLALESLVKREFTQLSDVWSFGVTLWELMTCGQQPYAEVDPFEMAAYLRDGYRLFQPINCPDRLYDIMICCWNVDPEARPTFPQLYSCLQDFHQTLGKYI